MALNSPGILENEATNQLTVSRATGGSAAIVGKFNWGPVFERVHVIDENELAYNFGNPDNDTADYFLNAANYLEYGSNLSVVRVINEEEARNASPIFGSVGAEITNAGSNYSVGDKLIIRNNGETVEDTAFVREVDDEGAILSVMIPSTKIINKAIITKTYPKLDYGWSIEAAQGSSGVSGTLKLLPIADDSGITVLNNSDARSVIEGDVFQKMITDAKIPPIIAAYPGEFGDGLEITVISKKSFDAGGTIEMPVYPTGEIRLITPKSLFQYGPQSDDQYCIVVSRAGIAHKKFIISMRAGDSDLNHNIFIDDYFANGQSDLIYATAKGWPKGFTGILRLGGGISANNAITESELMKGWDLFEDRETVNVTSFISGACAGENPTVASAVMKHASEIMGNRGDGEAYANAPRDLMLNINIERAIKNLVDWRTGMDGVGKEANFSLDSTYTFIVANYKYQYDKYNGVYRYIPLAGDIAGLAARTDAIAQPWMPIAGYTRGRIKNCIRLAIEPREGHRDRLYEVALNAVIPTNDGQGFILYGDKTATNTPTPFDRLNVRRLTNYIKRSISNRAKYNLWELNDVFTRSAFRTETGAFFGTIQDLGGVYDYRVVCDESNNTPTVIDNNEFVSSFNFKPARSINNIILNYVATSTGANFDELVSAATRSQ